jgi:hypothetical protein
MKSIVVVLALIILSLIPQAVPASSGDKDGHLFIIERSKNKNLVQYAIRPAVNRNDPDSKPVVAYWVLENGKHEELNSIEKKYAYGIIRQEKIDTDKFKIMLAAFKSIDIIVKKINNSFKAMISIDGKESILQKIYIKSEETGAGFPKVLYIDLIARNKDTGRPVKERITPKN